MMMMMTMKRIESRSVVVMVMVPKGASMASIEMLMLMKKAIDEEARRSLMEKKVDALKKHFLKKKTKKTKEVIEESFVWEKQQRREPLGTSKASRRWYRSTM